MNYIAVYLKLIQHCKLTIHQLKKEKSSLQVQVAQSHPAESVQLFSRIQLFAAPRTAARQTSLSITNSQSLLKLMSMESVVPSNHPILCHPLLLLPPIFPSIRVFSNESVLHIRWPKYWSFSFSISPSNEYSGLISFRIDWLDLLAVQGTLKGLLQHHNSKASILWQFSWQNSISLCPASLCTPRSNLPDTSTKRTYWS